MSHPEQSQPTGAAPGHERPGGYDEDPRQDLGAQGDVRQWNDQQMPGGHAAGPGHGVDQYGGQYVEQQPGQHAGEVPPQRYGTSPGYGGEPGAYPGPPDRGSGAPGEPADGSGGGSPDPSDGRQPAEHGTIFDPQRAAQWRSQWEDVRMSFVDRPRDAVAHADALVGEVLEELSRTFAQQRSALDPNALGGDPSTEEMRRAVQRYREFFDRLLTL